MWTYWGIWGCPNAGDAGVSRMLTGADLTKTSRSGRTHPKCCRAPSWRESSVAGWLYQMPGSNTGNGTSVALLGDNLTNTTLYPIRKGDTVSWVNCCEASWAGLNLRDSSSETWIVLQDCRCLWLTTLDMCINYVMKACSYSFQNC